MRGVPNEELDSKPFFSSPKVGGYYSFHFSPQLNRFWVLSVKESGHVCTLSYCCATWIDA